MDKIQVHITKNTRFESSKKLLQVNRKEPFQDILARVRKKLGMDEVKVLYNEAGAIVEDAEEMKDGEVLYASEGEKVLPQDKVAGVPHRNESEPKVLKLIVIGGPATGKSALLVKYTRDIFVDEYLPSFEDIYKKNIMIEGEQVELDIMDAPSFDELVRIRPSSYREREAFIMVYAIDSRSSFAQLRRFNEQLRSFRSNVDAPILVVANKSDLKSTREVTKQEGLKIAIEFNAAFCEASAKTNLNVSLIFERIAHTLFTIKYKPSAAAPQIKNRRCCLL